jgi:hypothetical protein
MMDNLGDKSVTFKKNLEVIGIEEDDYANIKDAFQDVL